MPATALVWTTLLFVVLFAVAAYVIIAVRRARSEHRARSDERAAAMMLALHSETTRAKARAPDAPVASVRPSPPGLGPSAPTPAPSALVRRPRILTDTQRLLYLVLRSGMPDHSIMANIRIIDLLAAPSSPTAIERDARLRELLHERADFIVCNAELVPVAALVIYEAGIQTVPDERIKVAALRELGVNFLRFRADSLPRPAEIRGLILG